MQDLINNALEILPFEFMNYAFMKNAFMAILLATPIFAILGTEIVNNLTGTRYFRNALAGKTVGNVVHKTGATVIEKAGQYYKTLEEGTHFYMPIAYQRVAMYCIVPQVRRYLAKSGNILSITFQIEDAKTYHYNHTDFQVIMRKIEEENSEIDLAVMETTFARYGLKFINSCVII